MSSTKDDKKINEFWMKHLAPISEALNDRGIKLIDDNRSGSSWCKPDDLTSDFENLTDETILENLRERFRRDDLDELFEIVPELLKLASELKIIAEEDNEIDPYVYVMH